MPSDKDQVGYVMSKKVVTVTQDAPIASVLKLMVKHGIGSVVVLEGGKPVGMITERDFVNQISEHGARALEGRVSRVASRPLVSVGPKTEIWEAFTIMLRKKIRRLAVMKDERLVGIVTERDLFRWVVMVAYEPNIPAEISKLIAQNP
ncbi:MAG: CBS domain-containing protein [Thaumarchaeota archaeon]|nr:CBS domain-containing protein [Nitrososphaerota archaeon]